MNASKENSRHKLFLPGQRIVRTVGAVMLCMIVYELRRRRGMPIFALIAAVMCIQPYSRMGRAHPASGAVPAPDSGPG